MQDKAQPLLPGFQDVLDLLNELFKLAFVYKQPPK